jgi:hypothetical protein
MIISHSIGRRAPGGTTAKLGETTLLSSASLLRMADYCRDLAQNRCSSEAKRALLRMASAYELRAARGLQGARA